jgi:hypothetical protein
VRTTPDTNSRSALIDLSKLYGIGCEFIAMDWNLVSTFHPLYLRPQPRIYPDTHGHSKRLNGRLRNYPSRNTMNKQQLQVLLDTDQSLLEKITKAEKDRPTTPPATSPKFGDRWNYTKTGRNLRSDR